MLITELIKELEEIKAEHGDVEVKVETHFEVRGNLLSYYREIGDVMIHEHTYSDDDLNPVSVFTAILRGPKV